ncbi:hypothetical protein QBC43DRAFT_333494 [Cladorrhinum sp. PSN259]|nr:hypothetical protein QBC43DRAFT_333494 [Cladorrhinum sp. PSN259]
MSCYENPARKGALTTEKPNLGHYKCQNWKCEQSFDTYEAIVKHQVACNTKTPEERAVMANELVGPQKCFICREGFWTPGGLESHQSAAIPVDNMRVGHESRCSMNPNRKPTVALPPIQTPTLATSTSHSTTNSQRDTSTTARPSSGTTNVRTSMTATTPSSSRPTPKVESAFKSRHRSHSAASASANLTLSETGFTCKYPGCGYRVSRYSLKAIREHEKDCTFKRQPETEIIPLDSTKVVRLEGSHIYVGKWAATSE